MNKKAVSVIVAYVLLISIAITLSVLVYNWLRFYVSPGNDIECPDGVRLVIKSYECGANQLNVTLENKGLFNVSGFIIRVNDREDATIGKDVVFEPGIEMAPGQEETFSEIDIGDYGSLEVIDVQPFIYEGRSRIYCDVVSTQSVVC